MCDPRDLSFIRVKGPIGMQLSAERLNPVTTVTLCASRMTRVTWVNADSYIISHADFYLMEGGVYLCQLPFMFSCLSQLLINAWIEVKHQECVCVFVCFMCVCVCVCLFMLALLGINLCCPTAPCL